MCLCVGMQRKVWYLLFSIVVCVCVCACVRACVRARAGEASPPPNGLTSQRAAIEVVTQITQVLVDSCRFCKRNNCLVDAVQCCSWSIALTMSSLVDWHAPFSWQEHQNCISLVSRPITEATEFYLIDLKFPAIKLLRACLCWCLHATIDHEQGRCLQDIASQINFTNLWLQMMLV